ncbi:MAG TPA: SRPBCC family protein [bacterium]|nr:SRPBCC family protein [bacterium]
MKTHLLKSSLWLPAARDRVFSFFADPKNLQQITPPWLHFTILRSSTPQIAAGTLLDYKLRLRGVPIRWQSEITVWDPPLRFVDEQRKGPYRRWVHQHLLTEKEGGTQVEDLVEYAVLGGSLVHRLLVRPDLERVFAYRSQALQTLFRPT